VRCPIWGHFIVFAIAAYSYLLFAYLIINLLQNLAQVRIPDWLRPAVNFLYDTCDPFLRIFRGMIPSIGMLDISPILAFFVLRIAAGILGRVVGC